jgi:hypothetical protein
MMAELTEAWTQFRPHAGQAELWACRARFVAVAAGRGSGKTELAKRRLVRFLPVSKPWRTPKYFYAAPTRAQAKLLAWDDLLSLVPEEWIAKKSDISLTDLCIKTIFGSELWVMGLDKPARIEGLQWDGCVLDESCDIKPRVFDKTMRPALTHRNGWCWRIGVPKRQGPGAKEFKRFYEQAVAGRIPEAMGFTWPSSDILPPEALAAAKASMDPKDYREQFEAQWETAGGQLFHSFDRAYNVRPCSYHRDKAIVVGSDFNVDPMAWVLGHRWKNRIEWFDELWLRDTNTQAALDALAGRYGDHPSGWEFYGDASGKARKTSAAKTDRLLIEGHPAFIASGRTTHYLKSNPPVVDRIAACNVMLCNAAGDRRLFVDPRCARLIDDLESRHYKPGTRDPADTGDLGHITDAMGYPVHQLFPIRIPLHTEPQTVIVRQHQTAPYVYQ